ncbi:rRNA maturation RNase YbeY [candidate division WOR-3 bacterium RBG_13_43_14]|uniref:rRNA maturation RNase YbeY n=1 Tax=candidate division WOR-3 bacterium RBG_13_43_14 TaxID=1802590 RepID=A0A1F4UCI2_UNCW3|nr:MAG: rRNA maturation RNase YbeY [candidate division WOR-3 bacterium RBG_13_43_14]
MKVNIFNRSKRIIINKRTLSQIIQQTIKKEKCTFDQVNIIITTDRYMRKLNNRYLKKDRATNVIAFNLGAVGEIYVSAELARDRYDLHFFIIHGTLHICGYNDGSVLDRKLIDSKTLKLLENV